MERSPVTSSNISEIGFQDGTLEVLFMNGSVYQYDDVPFEAYSALIDADSVGSHFFKNIRDQYTTTRVS